MTSTRITAIALGIALLAPGTAAAQQDLRNPDNRPAVQTPAQDLRGPDAVDAGRSDLTAPASAPAAPRQSPAPTDDTPWLSIAIVLGATFAIAAAIVTQTRRRRTPRVTA